ncbi:hypothetical protein ARMGADRAFT_1025326 [Armillaria gallica]|uniref:Uncharacterized protein n=1 Tax=Armillaria gallica TaxID=47427 RepID=A0A2H3ECH9_ARMGA|nr:hypothetical protein ARMGADRAFT_1025326 [Armillaria gallica]
MTLSDMLLLCTGVASFLEALLLSYLGLYFVSTVSVIWICLRTERSVWCFLWLGVLKNYTNFFSVKSHQVSVSRYTMHTFYRGMIGCTGISSSRPGRLLRLHPNMKYETTFLPTA